MSHRRLATAFLETSLQARRVGTRRYTHLAKRSTLLPLVRSASNLFLPPGPSYTEATQHVRTWADNRTSEMGEIVVPFFISTPDSRSRPVGFLRPQVLNALQVAGAACIKAGGEPPWTIYPSVTSSGLTRPTAVSFAPWVNEGGSPVRSTVLRSLVAEWRATSAFPSILKGRGEEVYPIYYPNFEVVNGSGDSVAFTIERAALPLFGFANYGSLLIAFSTSSKKHERMIWIARRSPSKKTWPGALDVTVGGGIGITDTPLSAIIRESAEEASFDSDFIRSTIRSVGAVSYPNRSPDGWILPGFYYLFELPLQDHAAPKPRINTADGEVDAFNFMTVAEVLERLVEGKFKPSSALALVDFLIRHGHVTDETDTRFAEICMSLRRDLVLPIPW